LAVIRLLEQARSLWARFPNFQSLLEFQQK